MNMRARLSIALMLAVACRLAAADEPNTLSPEEIEDGWILLFDGQTDFGWKASTKANWKVADGTISVSEGEKGLLCTTSEFADYVLKVDFRAPRETNSGIFLRTPAVPSDPAADCYELNIADPSVSPFSTGSLVNRQKAAGTVEPGPWHTFTVKAEGGHFTVAVDGRRVLDYVDDKPLGRGFIGLQFNSGPVAFRNIKLKPLGLENMTNGRDLGGWTVFPGKPSQFSVTPEGALRVVNGPGQLEWQGQVADFVLQLDIFSAGKHLNSGIFFRNLPGQLWQGYESQVQNGYKNEDRTHPLDCGTGGFYRRQNARKVVPNDFEWFTKTLVVSGDHMAAWINGYQVSDWTDQRPPHENPRQGLRRAAGTIAIQGHDPTTDLSFRKLRIAELPPR
jgi:hypothetical protein